MSWPYPLLTRILIAKRVPISVPRSAKPPAIKMANIALRILSVEANGWLEALDEYAVNHRAGLG
jgi:hypothetical protein